MSISILFIFISHHSYSQINTSISNLLRYGNGERVLGITEDKFQYFENLTDVRINLPGNFTVGFRLLYDDPPEVGLPFKGLARRFIEYRDDEFKIRIGNSSELYGRGLVLNLFENRGLAYDTWIDGIKASYKTKNLRASLIAGTINFSDSINIYRTEEYKIKGGNIEYDLLKNTSLGISFVSTESQIPQFDQSIADLKAELPEIYLDVQNGPFSLFMNWAHKWSYSQIDGKSSRGYGIYSAFSYAGRSIGITLEYKNYRFDLQDPFLKNDETRTTKFLSFQNAPIVMKEHSYILLSRSLHQVNFNDDVGFQVDINFMVNPDLNFNFNYSQSSTHNSYNYSASSFQFEEDKRANNFLPSTNDKYSPFSEIFLEGEYYYDFNTAVRFGIARRTKTYYNDFTGIEGSHIIKSYVLPFQLEHTFSRNFSGIIQYEYENVDDNYNTGQQNFNNHFISILTSIYKRLSFSLRYEMTTNDFELSERKDWLISEIGYRISGSNLISLSAGRERGGQICSNGICRYILPFKGFKLTLQTSI